MRITRLHLKNKIHTSKLGLRNKYDFKHKPSLVHDGGCTKTHIE